VTAPDVVAPPGWYWDGIGNYRWWDGTQWGVVAPPPDPVESGRTLAIIVHFGALAGGFLLPLVVYLTEGKKNTYVKHHAAEALNFQITFMLIWVGCFVVFFVSAVSDSSVAIAVMFLVALPAFLGNYVLSILGAVRASQRRWWRYPVNIRFVAGAQPQGD
jgi:uncharacterized Tic20 family protein